MISILYVTNEKNNLNIKKIKPSNKTYIYIYMYRYIKTELDKY